MSFLTSLFLVVFLTVGSCLPQNSDPFVLLQITMEAIGEKQDMILQRLDDIQTNVTKLQVQKENTQDCSTNTQVDAFKNTFLSEQGEMRNSLLQCSTTQELTSLQHLITEGIDQLTSATQKMTAKISGEYHQCQRTIEEDGNTTDNDTRTIEEDGNTTDNDTRTIEEDGNTTNNDTRTIEEDGNTTDNDTRRTMGSNCKEVLENGGIHSGVYTITPKGFSEGVKVFCDQMTNGGGWTVILERKRPAQVNFSRSFEEYAAGFGDPNGELWIGNRVLHSMTGEDPFTLRVEATGVEGQYWGPYWEEEGGSSEDYGGSRYGIWETFSVGGEDTQFRLSVGGYSYSSSTLGDAITNQGIYGESCNNQQFSTYDRDNDGHAWAHCSIESGKGGWWYDSCYDANPTAPLGDALGPTKAEWQYWNQGSSSPSAQLISTITFKIRK